MAAPTAPTAASIAEEGLKRSGLSAPTAAEITEAQTWLEDVKNDLWRIEKKLKALYTTKAIVISKGRWRYSLPTDYSSNLTIVLISGSVTGTATDGAVGSITLEAGEDVTIGDEILVTAGTGVDSFSQITAWSDPVATVTPNFATAPVNTDTYMIIDNYVELDHIAIRDLSQYSNPTTQGKPIDCYLIEDDDYGEIIVRPVPDGTYGLLVKYYVNLMTLDLTDTLMTLLYRKWFHLFVQYVLYRSYKKQDDTNASGARSDYEVKLRQTIVDEISNLGEEALSVSPKKR